MTFKQWRIYANSKYPPKNLEVKNIYYKAEVVRLG